MLFCRSFQKVLAKKIRNKVVKNLVSQFIVMFFCFNRHVFFFPLAELEQKDTAAHVEGEEEEESEMQLKMEEEGDEFLSERDADVDADTADSNVSQFGGTTGIWQYVSFFTFVTGIRYVAENDIVFSITKS